MLHFWFLPCSELKLLNQLTKKIYCDSFTELSCRLHHCPSKWQEARPNLDTLQLSLLKYVMLFQIQSFHLTCFTIDVLATYKMFEYLVIFVVKLDAFSVSLKLTNMTRKYWLNRFVHNGDPSCFYNEKSCFHNGKSTYEWLTYKKKNIIDSFYTNTHILQC